MSFHLLSNILSLWSKHLLYLYNEDYDDDEPIEAGRKGSSIYIQHNKVRLYTPSNTSSIGPQERYKSKSNLISDNEEVLTMSDIDVSNDG